MNNLTSTHTDALRVAVRVGLPDTTNALLTAALIQQIQELAESMGLRLDRFTVVPEGVENAWEVTNYWVVSDLPSEIQFDNLDTATTMLREQIHVRLPWAHDDTVNGEFVLYSSPPSCASSTAALRTARKRARWTSPFPRCPSPAALRSAPCSTRAARSRTTSRLRRRSREWRAPSFGSLW